MDTIEDVSKYEEIDGDHLDDDHLDDDHLEDDSGFKCWCCKSCSRRWQEDDWRKMIAEEYPVEIDDEEVWCCSKTSYDI